MIRVAAKEGLLGEGAIHRVEIPSARGMTARRVIEICREIPELRQRPLAVAVNGHRLAEAEMDRDLPDGAEVLVASPQQDAVTAAAIGELILEALIYAAVSIAVSYVVSLILPKPKPPGVPQDRGDQESATYAWDGITTSYGQGQPVAFGYGRHALGGQVIFSRVIAGGGGSSTLGTADFLSIILALCEGPIHRVGDLIAGEQNSLGGPGNPLPTSLRINETFASSALTDIRAWIRSGELNQSPLDPSFSGAFPGTSTVFLVNAELAADTSEAIFSLLETEEIASLRLTISFPSGCYVVDPAGNKQPVTWPFVVEWRPSGASAWALLLGANQVLPFIAFEYASYGVTCPLPTGVFGPIDVRVRRVPRTTTPPGQIVDQGLWRQVASESPHTFSYPGTALLGLAMRATSQLRGTLPQIQVTCDLRLVRVWDESTGWSPRCWDVPAAPFDWMTNPPGRNPAWIAVDFLLDPIVGLGRWFTEADLDLPSARRWSILCDSEPNPGDPWGEAAFTCDYVADSPRPAWERLLAICAAGRCTPVRIGKKISFVYQYRDAHSDALVSVPAKAPVQLITSSNCEDLAVTWMPRSRRSSMIQYQFLNEAKDYKQDVLPVEDPEGTANDPNNPLADEWQPEVTQAYGVTRESQLLREGMFTHRLQRGVTHEVTFRAGPWTLAATVGDLIAVEHEILRPFSPDVASSCVIEADGFASFAMIVDHVIAGTGLRVVYRDGDGVPVEVDIASLTALPGGRTQLNLATPQTFLAGRPAVVGKVGKLTNVYLIVAIGLAQDLRREVRAIEWVPSAFEPIGPDFFSEPPTVAAAPPARSSAIVVIDVMPRGGHAIAWSSSDQRSSRARVWAKQVSVGQWMLLGESITSRIETRALAPHQDYEIAVCFDQGNGSFLAPESVDASAITAPEFPREDLPPIRQLTIEAAHNGLRFSWPAYGHTDLAYYELRAGATWVTGRPIYCGQIAEVVIDRPPASTTFMVAVRSTSGLYGEPAVAEVPAAWAPPEKVALTEMDSLDLTPVGAITGLVYDGGRKSFYLDDGEGSGEYEELEMDAGYVAPWEWRVEHDFTVFDDFTCGEEAGLCGDGEARWATCAIRPPSPSRPGVAFDDSLVGDDIGLCGDEAPFEACGGSGELGELVSVKLESRVHDGASWGDWDAHVDRVVVSRKLQVRTRVERASDRVGVEINRFITNGFL